MRQFRLLSAGTFCLVLATSAVAGDVTGTVRDHQTSNPIAGALVSWQASGLNTTTAPDGSFTLTVPDGTNLVVVGAAKGYFNTSVVSDAPSGGVEIRLPPVPASDDPTYQLVPPTTCGNCHPDQYEQWAGSAMANAGFNTWVDDIYSGTGTPNGMGGFVYLRDSVFAATNPASECASCHQPELWINDPFVALEGPSADPSPELIHGVSCEVCHKVADVDVAKINFPGIFPGAVTFTRPSGPNYHQVQYGVLGDADYSLASTMRPSYQPQLVAEVCAACHQDANDPDENHTYAGVISEPTYLEWVVTPYADQQSPLYADCVDCHMPAFGATEACVALSPPLVRDPDTIRSHRIEGTTAQYLENAVEMSMTAQQVGGEIAVHVNIANTLTGHHVPTGVTVRNMILVIEAWREEDELALVSTGMQTIHDLGGVGDPAQGYYAGLPGKFYAKVNHDADGNGPTFFTDATGIQFDNRLPALTSDGTDYSFTLPPDGGTMHVRARLIYRRAFRFLVDAKQWTEDGHGNPLADVAPPHFGHLMELAEHTIVLPAEGACCDVNAVCTIVLEADCVAAGGIWAGALTDCADTNGNGIADACHQVAGVPTVSEWGLVIMALLGLAVGSIVHRRTMSITRPCRSS